MARRTGYLSNIDNIPPLVFRFQFNPEVLSDKKSYKYDPAPSFGLWSFDQAKAAGSPLAVLAGLFGDLKQMGPLLLNTKPFDPKEGEPRQITLEFKLDASVPGPLDDASGHGSILPDIAILRSFMVPGMGFSDVITAMIKKEVGCFIRPPTCGVSYGHVSMTGVMTDLDLKIVDFFEDGEPRRAEVSCTVKEQTFSMYPIADTIGRIVNVSKAIARPTFLGDVLDSQVPTFVSDIILKR